MRRRQWRKAGGMAVCLTLLGALFGAIPVLAQGGDGRTEPQASGTDFYVANRGPGAIEQVYVSPSGARNWGRERLGRAAIPRGESRLVRETITDGCQADIRVVYAGGGQVERRNQNVCRINRLSFAEPLRRARPREITELAIRNEGAGAVRAVYLTNAGDRDWGRNWLGREERIEKGETLPLDLPRGIGCVVDVRIDYGEGASTEFHNEYICQPFTLVVFAPQLEPIQGGPQARRDPQGGGGGGGDGERDRDRNPGGGQSGGGQQAGGRPGGGSDPGGRVGGNGNVTVVNAYRLALRELYISPASAREWGRDLLPERVLVPPAASYAVQVDTARECQFDVKAVWDSDAEQTIRNLNLCTGRPVSLAGPPAGAKLWSGTGFYIAPTGHILTNEHVVRGCQRVEIARPNGPSVPLRVIAEDRDNDLALLQDPNTPVKSVVFRPAARPLRAGETSIALGYPIREVLGSLIVTTGIVSSLSGSQGDTSRFQMQTPIQPGNSGGPVFDESGQVIGVSVARIERIGGRAIQNVNFAVKADVARRFAEANGVRVQEAPPGPRLSPADITEQQEAKVLALVCYN